MFERLFKRRADEVLADEAVEVAQELVEMGKNQNNKLDAILREVRLIAARMDKIPMEITGYEDRSQ